MRAGNSHGQAHLETCISYLRARINNQLSVTTPKAPLERLLAQAERAYEKENYGQARLLLENLLPSIERTHPSYLDATILLARSCAEMNDTKAAMGLIWPIFAKLPEKSRHKISPDVALWLWDDLVFQEYTSVNDESYRLALEIHLELALTAKAPDDVLRNLRSLTRWLELLGAGNVVQWIRQLIRTEAPGTWYVDKHYREQYVRNVNLSQDMGNFLIAFEKRIRADATAQLKHVMKSSHSLETDESLLDGH